MSRSEYVQRWARELLASEFVIFDFETTGLTAYRDRVVQIGIIDQNGQTRLDTLVNPGGRIPRGATRIHGITDAMVANAPTWKDVYSALFGALDGKIWLVYNLNFDRGFLLHECQRLDLTAPQPLRVETEEDFRHESHCVMRNYARYWGEPGWRGGYKWQSLSDACRQQGIIPRSAHNAIADCLLTLELLKKIAG
jgi:DNA polymerase-3 subunit epsilon